MKRLIVLSDTEAKEVRSALLGHIKDLSKFAHSKSVSSESSSKALDRIDISEEIINKINRIFFK